MSHFIFFQAGTVTNPAIWLVLSAVRIHGHSNACVSFFPWVFFSFESLEKINKLFTGLGSVRIVKTVTSDLKMLPSACGLGQHFKDLGHSFSLRGLGQHFQDLGHSFSLYGPPSRQIIYFLASSFQIAITYCTFLVGNEYIHNSVKNPTALTFSYNFTVTTIYSLCMMLIPFGPCL